MKTKTIFMALTLLITMGVSASAYDATNVIVDFDLTDIDESLMKGESGVLNLVIKNTGDYEAEDVEVWIQGNSRISSDKRMYIGVVEGGQSKSLPVTLKVNDDASTGLVTVSVEISYDGYDSDGDRENNQHTSWQIPLRITGDPMFQVKPKKTTYYKDTVEELVLEVSAESSAKNLQATLDSDCLTIIGSAREYLGNIQEDEEFNIKYKIKPTAEGACTADLLLEYSDYSGSTESDELTLGLNIEEAGVDFKILGVEYDETGPGDVTELKVTVKNVGEANAEDVSFTLSLEDPFSPADTSEKYLEEIAGKETKEIEFKISTSWDADIQTYTIPLMIEYKVGGTTNEVEKELGFDVSGKVILEIISVESSGSTTKVQVVNLGTRNAEGVKATLVTSSAVFSQSQTSSSGMTSGRQSGGMGVPGMQVLTGGQRSTTNDAGSDTQEVMSTNNQTQQLIEYKSDIKSSKETTFTFDAAISGTATLILEYNGPKNERVTQEEKISALGTSSSSSGISASSFTRSRNSGTSPTTYLIAGVVLLAAGYFGYRKWKGEKLLENPFKK